MDMWESAVRMVASLALVLGLMLGLLALAKTMMGRRLLGVSDTQVVRVLGSTYVGPRKSVVVVEVAGEVLILGATATELVSLGRLTDPERVKQVLAHAGAGGKPLDRVTAFTGSVGEHARG